MGVTSHNCSYRMTNVAGAMVCAQMPFLQSRVDNWNTNMAVLMEALAPASPHLVVPEDEEGAESCADHCVFSLPNFSQQQRDAFTKHCKELGVEVKPFGTNYNARFFKNWKFMGEVPEMPHTEHIVRTSFDMKLPFNFT